jgi:hypothetical protein
VNSYSKKNGLIASCKDEHAYFNNNDKQSAREIKLWKSLSLLNLGWGRSGPRLPLTYLLERDNVELVAAIDIDPDKIGCDSGTLIGSGEPHRVIISGAAEATLAMSDADVVILSTLSSVTSRSLFEF